MTDAQTLHALCIKLTQNPQDDKCAEAATAQLDKCQNRESSDGSVFEREWYAARNLIEARNNFVTACRQYEKELK